MTDGSTPASRRLVAPASATAASNSATHYMRLQNALIAWSEVAAGAILRHLEPSEIVVVLPDTAAETRIDAPARSIGILPPGPCTIEAKTAGRIIQIFAPVPAHLAALAANAADYETLHTDVRPIGAPLTRTGASGIRIYEIDRAKVAAGRRPPSFQTGAMNVMWIERAGVTDRSKLDPHSHEDFEEGALVVSGNYIEHLRTPWGADAGQWRADEHVTCSPGMLIIVPPTVIHTTETVGDGQHLMLNVFAPARADHIKSGMVLNAVDYRSASN